LIDEDIQTVKRLDAAKWERWLRESAEMAKWIELNTPSAID